MFGKTASLVRLMCKPREATISWLHLACVSRRWLQNRLHVRLQNKCLGGLHLKPLVKPLQKPSQTGPQCCVALMGSCSATQNTVRSFGRASGAVSRAAPGEALPNVCFVTGFTCEAGPEAIGGLHRQSEAMKSWLHAAYTSI